MTVQVGERLIYNGYHYYMGSEPFFQYLKKKDLHIQLVATNTACWRGFKGEWEVIDGKLYLNTIEGSGYLFVQDKFYEGRLKLRQKLKEGIITPQQNGHLLKELEKECLVPIDLSVDIFFYKGETRISADWFTGSIYATDRLIQSVLDFDEDWSNDKQLYLEFENGIDVTVSKQRK